MFEYTAVAEALTSAKCIGPLNDAVCKLETKKRKNSGGN